MDMHSRSFPDLAAPGSTQSQPSGFGRCAAGLVSRCMGALPGWLGKRIERIVQGRPDPGATVRNAEALCRLDEIPDGGVLGVYPPDPAGMPLLLARSGSRVQGWLNICPQDGGRMEYAPGLFQVADGELRCARRGAVFALDEGGICVRGPCRGRALTQVPLCEKQGMVMRA